MSVSVRKALLWVLTCTLFAGALSAQIWDETTNGGGDAGELPAAAQLVNGTGALTAITGNVPTTTDRDLYRIRITNPAAFSATTSLSPGTNVDTELYLFTTAGAGIAMNDDISTVSFLSTLPVGNPLYANLVPGEYLIGVYSYPGMANSVAGAMFTNVGTINIGAPNGIGGGTNTHVGWNASGVIDLGTYRITLTGCEYAAPVFAPYYESFDKTMPGILPPGWSSGGADLSISAPWVVGNTANIGGPNTACVLDVGDNNERWLQSPAVRLGAAPNHLSFRHIPGTESGFDGCVLEISINNAAFVDIVWAGGVFIYSGYNTLVTMSTSFATTLQGRPCWSGINTILHSVIQLPPAAAGQAVAFRWRHASDTTATGSSAPFTGWFIDDVMLNAPLVTDMNVTQSLLAGGTSVTATGYHLEGVTGVNVGANAATQVAPSANFVSFVTPTAAAAASVAVVFNAGLMLSDSQRLFRYNATAAAPVVTGISPAASVRGLATSVTITGTNLTGATSVTFNGVAATSIVVGGGGTSLTCLTPTATTTIFTATGNNATIGPASVIVTNPSGTNGQNSLFTFTAPNPTITGHALTSSPPAGGFMAQITGAHLVNVLGVLVGTNPTIRFFAMPSSTQLIAEFPAGAVGSVPSTVLTQFGQITSAALFTYTAPGLPTVASLTPAIGNAAGGTRVRIRGTNLQSPTGVTFGALLAPATIVETQPAGLYVDVIAPAGSGAGQSVVVTTAAGANIPNALWTWGFAIPTVTVPLPTPTGSVAGGDYVLINGTNFRHGLQRVTFNNVLVLNVQIVSDTQLRVLTPPGAVGTLLNVAVTNAAGTSVANTAWSYTAAVAPTVTSALPNTGPLAGGTSIYIYGNNFITGATVTVGGVAATGVVVVSKNVISCVTPAGTVGLKNVVVTTTAGIGTLTNGFGYTAPPAITSVAPTTTQVNVLFTYNITTTGFPVPTLSATPLPAWLTLVGSVLSGTPPATGVVPTITLTASNGLLPNATQAININVTGQPPAITSAPVTVATVGMAYFYVVQATGIPTPALSATGVPAWLTFSPSTGLLSGEPTGADLGLSATITITANNGVAPNATQAFQIQVNGTSPLITSTAPTTAQVGALYSYTVVATGNPVPAIGVAGQPAWLTLVGNVLSGTPGAADLGTTGMITLTASNGRAPADTEQFQITVDGIAPQIVSTAITTATAGSPYVYTVVATGDPAVGLSALGLPAWLTLVGNVLSGTPSGANVGATGNITITASNGVAPDDTQVFIINVGGSAPAFTSTAVTLAGGNIPYNYHVTASGTPAPTLAVTSTLPAWLSFSPATGQLSGTPTEADVGVLVNVTITATNGVGTAATQSFTIMVTDTTPETKKDEGGSCSAGTSGMNWLALAALVGLLGLGLRARSVRE